MDYNPNSEEHELSVRDELEQPMLDTNAVAVDSSQYDGEVRTVDTTVTEMLEKYEQKNQFGLADNTGELIDLMYGEEDDSFEEVMGTVFKPGAYHDGKETVETSGESIEYLVSQI